MATVTTIEEASSAAVVTEPVDLFLLRYSRILEEERADKARAFKVTSRPAINPMHKSVSSCVYCSNLATVDLLFHHRARLPDGEVAIWIIVEKHCDSCAKRHHPELVASSTEDQGRA